METLEEKLTCAFADIGAQVGDLIRCMVDQEIASHITRIQQLNSLLSEQTLCTQSDDVIQPNTGV